LPRSPTQRGSRRRRCANGERYAAQSEAERFIQTSLREWAYAPPFASSTERAEAMLPWIAGYNHDRPHSALAGKPPLRWIARSE